MTTPESRSWAYGSGGQLRAVWRIAAFASVYFLAQGIVSAIAEPVFSFASSKAGGVLSPSELMIALYTLAAVGFVLRNVDSLPWKSVGLDTASWQFSKLANGATLGVLAIAATCALLFLFGNLQFERDTMSTFLSGDAPGNSATTAWLLSTLRISLLLAPAAFSEELIFRGYLWRVCDDSANPTVALGVTSVLFGLTHLPNPGADALAIANVILAGLALGIVRQRTGSLPAAWAAHFAWNWVMAAALHVPVSGLALATPGYRTIVRGPTWISGGTWGPEGGLVAALVLIALAAFGLRHTSFEKQTDNFNQGRFRRSANGAH